MILILDKSKPKLNQLDIKDLSTKIKFNVQHDRLRNADNTLNI